MSWNEENIVRRSVELVIKHELGDDYEPLKVSFTPYIYDDNDPTGKYRAASTTADGKEIFITTDSDERKKWNEVFGPEVSSCLLAAHEAKHVADIRKGNKLVHSASLDRCEYEIDPYEIAANEMSFQVVRHLMPNVRLDRIMLNNRGYIFPKRSIFD